MSADECLIVDADVLIDFIKADRNIISIIIKHLAPVYVVRQVLKQVKAIESEEELTSLGVTVIDPEIEDLYTAAKTTSPTDFEDQLCYLTAKRHGFTCVTNDKDLRNCCIDDGVPSLRGLRLILRLCALQRISVAEAIKIAEQIHKNNPRYITKTILKNFIKALKQQKGSYGLPPDFYI